MAAAVEQSYAMRQAYTHTSSPQHRLTLEDKYQIVKEIGDGSFGSVVLGRTRTAGAVAVRRNTMVAIKTMKKTFDSFAQCLDLREVIFLRTLPKHPHLIPTYDIFLDPLSKRLHIAMEYMDGNLYQLMKSRDHQQLDSTSVESIMCQILSGLEHIHDHDFFHRDIKPENILVSTSHPETQSHFKRYSALMTPPSTPPLYTVKIADFGLARETSSKRPYTTYVSTRWYRAPEVLLRAGIYAAPVDIWALGAMAVELATLKPLFPGGNEVDQVWRVCEIMGSPGAWVDKNNASIGGGEWRDGIRLAQKLGFAFPKMAPQSLETLLPAPQWPPEFASFVTWCLLWDPAARPTSSQALNHEYFRGATDPLRPKSSTTSKLLGRKGSSITVLDSGEVTPSLSTKTSSWFRRSMGNKDLATVAPVKPDQEAVLERSTRTQRPVPMSTPNLEPPPSHKQRNAQSKPTSLFLAPRESPVMSPKPLTISTNTGVLLPSRLEPVEAVRHKVGRQLSVNSTGNHYADMHRQEAESTLSGDVDLAAPSFAKESFFSHLRKRARRFSAKPQDQISPCTETFPADLVDTTSRSNSNSNSYLAPAIEASGHAELDKVLHNVRCSLDATNMSDMSAGQAQALRKGSMLRRQQSTQFSAEDRAQAPRTLSTGPVQLSQRTRKGSTFETSTTSDESQRKLSDALQAAQQAAQRLDSMVKADRKQPPKVPTINTKADRASVPAPYLTPSSSKEDYRHEYQQANYGYSSHRSPDVRSSPSSVPRKSSLNPRWPATPPEEEIEWAASAAASIYAAQAAYH